jgi:hypothetical protein
MIRRGFFDWQKPVGETGDLADLVVGVIVLLKKQGLEVSEDQFYKYLPKALVEFTGLRIPKDWLYQAVERSLQLGVQLSSRFRGFEVSPQTLEKLKARAGERFIEKACQPIADQLAEKLKER